MSHHLSTTNSTIHTSNFVRFRFNGESPLSDMQSDLNKNVWQLAFLFPDGASNDSERTVGLCLICRKNPMGMPHSRATFIVRAQDGSAAIEVKAVFNNKLYSLKHHIIEMKKSTDSSDSDLEIDLGDLPNGEGQKYVMGNFIKLPELMQSQNNTLFQGVIVIDAVIEIRQSISPDIIPTNPLGQNMLKLLRSGDLADTSFEVEGEIILAHKLVLVANAPLLADLCKESTKETPVPIKGIPPDIFRLLLHYIYGEEVTNDGDDVLRIGFGVIDAANRFGLVELKLAIESKIVKNVELDVSNVAEYIIFADAMTCPLLKERAKSYFLARAKDVLKLESSAQLKESAELMQELMMDILDSADEPYSNNSGGYIDMPVETLREKLKAQNLSLDGSKETLVSVLETLDKKT